MKNKILNKLPLVFSVILLCAAVAVSSMNRTSYDAETFEPLALNEFEGEMKGIWVTYMDLNMTDTDMSFQSFKQRFNTIADTAKDKGFNTLIVQVRPFSDALYKSAFYPASHILSGVQGKAVSYDALAYMTEYAHGKEMKIEAWVNPYRVRSDKSLKLSDDNPYIQNPSIGVKVGGEIYLNPALDSVRKLIENGVREIVANYDVDGVQFDDYFYPTEDESFDESEYQAYVDSVGLENALTLSEWRMANVNILIADCHSIANKYDKRFGVAPQGNIDNDYHLCADVREWCAKRGYIDYICPQLYFSIDNPALKFEDGLKQWTELEFDESVSLYAGIAGYKTGTDSDSGTWLNENDILKRELKLIRKYKLKGVIFYSYADLTDERAAKEVANLSKELSS